MISLDQVAGLVLCKAGVHRVAFAARQVASIEALGDREQPAPQARWAFAAEPAASPPVESRVVQSEQGEGVVVDALEVHQEALPLLPPPGLIEGGVGGALRGFVAVGEQLYPVLRLPEFSRFLRGLDPEAQR